MELSFPHWVAIVLIGMASGGLPLSPAVAAAPEVTDRLEISGPAAGTGAGKQLPDGISLRPAIEVGEPLAGELRPVEKKRGTGRPKGEFLILMLHILRGPK